MLSGTHGLAVHYWLGDVTGPGTVKDLVMSRPQRVIAVLGPPIPFRLYNAASYLINPELWYPFASVAPLEAVTLFSANVGPPAPTPGQLDAQGRLSTGSGNTRVLFDGIPVPVLYTCSTQTAVIVPREIAPRTTTLAALERNGQIVGTVPFPVVPALPGIFTANSTSTGPVVAVNQDGTPGNVNEARLARRC